MVHVKGYKSLFLSMGFVSCFYIITLDKSLINKNCVQEMKEFIPHFGCWKIKFILFVRIRWMDYGWVFGKLVGKYSEFAYSFKTLYLCVLNIFETT